MVEHGQKLDEFGTPRAFEIIPYWTKQDTMEGTLMEASYTAPFHFINQAELSEEASNAIIGVDYPGLDVPAGDHPSAVDEHPLHDRLLRRW